MLHYTEISKNLCKKISVAIILLNNNTNEDYDGNKHNLALIYHEFINRYVLLVKQNGLFNCDSFIILKKSKNDSILLLQHNHIIKKISNFLQLDYSKKSKSKTKKNKSHKFNKKTMKLKKH